MNPPATDFHFFVLLIRHGSISNAAVELGQTPSAVSRRLSRLENRLKVSLINRTTRSMNLTSEGNAYYLGALEMIEKMEALEQSVSQSLDEPGGLLKVNATFQFGREQIAPAISEFIRKYPKVHVQLDLSDKPLDIIESGYDLCIKFGMPDAKTMVMRKLLNNRRVLIASPEYIKANGLPKTAEDLLNHQCIVLRQENKAYDIWRSEDDKTLHVTGNLATNDGEIAVNWVLSGHGIMLRSEWDIARHLKSGRLCNILPDFYHHANVYAVFPQKINMPAKVRLFVDFLHQRFQQPETVQALTINQP